MGDYSHLSVLDITPAPEITIEGIPMPEPTLAYCYKDQHGVPTINIDNTSYILPTTQSQGFRSQVGAAVRFAWFRQEMYRGQASDPKAVNEVVTLLETLAMFTGVEKQVGIRVVREDDVLYVDLGENDNNDAIVVGDSISIAEITPEDSVAFRRPKGTKSLVRPVPGEGDAIAAWGACLGLTQEQLDRVVLWMLCSLLPDQPCPVLVITGAPGSGKSYLCRKLLKMTDPRQVGMRAEPTTARDLFAAATNARVLGFTNVSRVTAAVSDSLCRLASGEADARRQLYTTAEEVAIVGERPVLINGVAVDLRGDLSSRALHVELPDRKSDERKTEGQLEEELAVLEAGVMWELCELLQRVVSVAPVAGVASLSRMADAAAVAVAAFGEDRAADVWVRNVKEEHRSLLECTEWWPLLRAFVEGKGEDVDTVTTCGLLLLELRELNREHKRYKLPANARVLGRDLRHLQEAARTGGIEVQFPERTAVGRPVSLSWKGELK